MAIKTFTTGEVLTAADTNTYLANSGLVYVTSSSFSGITTASPLNLDNVFTSTMSHYKLMIQITSTSVSTDINIKMRTGGTTNSNNNYMYGGMISYTGSTNLQGFGSGGILSQWPISTQDAANYPNTPISVEIMSPQDPYRTSLFSSGFTAVNPQPYYRQMGGTMTVTTAYDGFSLIPSTGTIAGTITVYGFREA